MYSLEHEEDIERLTVSLDFKNSAQDCYKMVCPIGWALHSSRSLTARIGTYELAPSPR